MAPDDDHHGQTGTIDPIYEDDEHVFLKLSGDPELYAYRRDEVVAVPAPRDVDRASEAKAPRAESPSTKAATRPSARPGPPASKAKPQPKSIELRLGGFAEVVAPGDDHDGQIGKIHTFFDDDDEFDVCMRFRGDSETYAYRRDEVVAVVGPQTDRKLTPTAAGSQHPKPKPASGSKSHTSAKPSAPTAAQPPGRSAYWQSKRTMN